MLLLDAETGENSVDPGAIRGEMLLSSPNNEVEVLSCVLTITFLPLFIRISIEIHTSFTLVSITILLRRV